MGGSNSVVAWNPFPTRKKFSPINRNIHSKNPVPKVANIPNHVVKVIYLYLYSGSVALVEDDSIGKELLCGAQTGEIL
jgi:hypothetical protein